jgi:hypothetical protein
VRRLNAEQPRIDLGTEHPLAAVATITLKPTGEAEIAGVDGRIFHYHAPSMPGEWAVASAVFDVATSTLRLVLHDDTEFVTEIGTTMSIVDRPVVYLDQNHWIDLARVRVNSPKISGNRKFACERLIELARNREIILPISGAHMVETAKMGGQQRTDLARTMIELSRGWQMRSPLRVREHELKRMLEPVNPTTSRWPDIDVFTLLPNAIWADRFGTTLPRLDDLPDEMRGLTERIMWAVALTELLLETDSDFSPEGHKSLPLGEVVPRLGPAHAVQSQSEGVRPGPQPDTLYNRHADGHRAGRLGQRPKSRTVPYVAGGGRRNDLDCSPGTGTDPRGHPPAAEQR